jgi:CRP/FNR family cyclic AMP-dependent transcriptional regulator
MLEAILAASEGLPELTFPDGADVITEGQLEVPLLVLISGSTRVSREDVQISEIAEPGAVFGELSALLSAPATATVRAVGECVFRVCDDPRAFLREHPELAIAIAQMLARRLDALTHYLVDVRNQYADTSHHLGVVDVVLESLSHHQGARADPGSDREREAPY